MAEVTSLPPGCFPTMITPMAEDGAIDFKRVRTLTEWYIEAGCTGLFANCLSSEMFNLTDEEQLELTKVVYEQTNKRAVVVSTGTGLNKSIEEQAEHIKRIAGVSDAVVVVVNQLAKADESDEVWKANVQKLLDLTPGIPLGLYECPKPYHRLLAPATLAWAAATGRFFFHKDTCCKSQPIREKLQALALLDKAVPFRFYNANVATLRMSIQEGGHGFSGISANFYPHLLVWLCANAGDARAAEVQAHLSVFENVVADTYPRSAKRYQQIFAPLQGPEGTRVGGATLNEEQDIKLRDLHACMEALCARLSIPVVVPKAL